MVKVTHSKRYKRFSIYINGILHLNLRIDNYVALQSWFEIDELYMIEITLKEGKPILCEYASEELWKKILNVFDKNL